MYIMDKYLHLEKVKLPEGFTRRETNCNEKQKNLETTKTYYVTSNKTWLRRGTSEANEGAIRLEGNTRGASNTN